MHRTSGISRAVAAGICLATWSCSSSADRSGPPEAAPADPAAASATAAGSQAANPAAISGVPGGPTFQPAGDSETQAREVRAFLDEVRPLAAACAGNVTIRSLVIMGSGAETQIMRLPPTPRPCESLTAEIQLWESRLATIEAN